MVEEIFDNCNCKRLVYADLCVGTRLRAKVGVVSIDDIGYSGRTFNYSAFIEGNEYEVVSVFRWGFTWIGYVLDEHGTVHFATPDVFDLI